MSNKEKFLLRKAEAQKANADAHKKDVLSGVKVRLTSNIYIKK